MTKSSSSSPPPITTAPHSERATLAQVKKAAGSQSLQSLQVACRGWTAAELDQTDPNKTPLHMAAWKGCLDNVRYLVETMQCHVNVYSQGQYSYGKTAIFFAATQSRVDVVDYLLSRNAKVTIVNNKGQSVRSIVSSHDMPPSMLQRITELEESQGDWWNFRETHSDRLEYGDLDPRFFAERPLRDTDVVTPLAINPTTKGTRKGGFARRNPHVYQQRVHQRKRAKGQQRRKQSPGLTPAQELQWDRLWEEWRTTSTAETCHDDPAAAMTTILLLLQRTVRLGNQCRKAWIPDTMERLLQLYNHDASRIHALLTEAQKSNDISDREIELVQKIQRRVVLFFGHGNDGDDGKKVSPVHSNTTPDTLGRHKIQHQQESWKHAASLVKNLSINELEENERSSQDHRILKMSQPPELVDTLEALQHLQEQLLFLETSKNNPFLIAVDAEWYDVQQQEGNVTSALSTVQIAFGDSIQGANITDVHARNRLCTYVVDLTVRDPGYHETAGELVRWILHSPDLIVLGFALSHDVHMLEKFAKESSSVEPKHPKSTFLDLQQLFAGNNRKGELPGLKACASKFSKIPLSKAEQCSEWGQRPLRQSQLDYAGLDAAILLVLLSEHHRRRQTDLRDDSCQG